VTCNCQSHNRPDWGGTQPEVVVPAPDWASLGRGTLCLDACIAPVIQRLWAADVVTLGSCCGHNLQWPSVVIEQTVDGLAVRELLREVDPTRFWRVLQWQLVDVKESSR
jgi:hypothetical protein